MGKDLLEKVEKLNFREDINFLRALAVLSVITYHIKPEFLPGGWLGVDMFFFISGYLISNKIIVDLNNGEFKFKDFYKKRIKRILPALFSVLIFTIPFAYILLPPKDLYIYLNSFVSSVLFYSNFFFQNLDFYNSPNSKLFPLLHMWSLSIEEQYYIIFPIILFLIYKFRKRHLFSFLIILTLFSIFLNVIDFGNIMFYQLHFRIWEFFIGVIFTFTSKKFEFSTNTKIIGLSVMLFSLISFNDSMINIFYTKFICLLGVFLYLSKTKITYKVEAVNQIKIIQHIGLISYSLYLFHQPIFVFLRIFESNVRELSFYVLPLSLLFLFFISHLNWKLIETPFQQNFTNKKQLVLFGSFFALVLSTTTLLYEDSFVNKFSDLPSKVLLLSFKNQDVVSQNGVSCDNRTVDDTCVFTSPLAKQNIYVIGDSSLRTLSSALLESSEIKNYNLIHFGGNDCMFLLNTKVSKESCPKKEITEMDNFIRNINNSIVVYGGRIPRYLSGKGFDNTFVAENNDILVIDDFEIKLIETIEFLANKNQIILLYPIPEQGWNIPELYFYKKVEWGETVSYPSFIWYERTQKSNNLLNSIKSENILRIYPDEIFCDSFVKDECVGAINEMIFYSDDDHLSIEGSRLLAKKIFEALEKN